VSSYTSSSLTLRSLLKSAASRLRLGVPAARVSGLTAPAKALFAAVAAERGRLLLVVPTDADIDLTSSVSEADLKATILSRLGKIRLTGHS